MKKDEAIQPTNKKEEALRVEKEKKGKSAASTVLSCIAWFFAILSITFFIMLSSLAKQVDSPEDIIVFLLGTGLLTILAGALSAFLAFIFSVVAIILDIVNLKKRKSDFAIIKLIITAVVFVGTLVFILMIIINNLF